MPQADGTALRGGPGETTVVRAELDEGDAVTVTGEPMVAGEATWWPVTVDDTGTLGWIDGDQLEAAWPED